MAHSSHDGLDVLQSVFEKYDREKKGFLDCDQFVYFISQLGKYVSELGNIEEETLKAFFDILTPDEKLTFETFRKWWFSSSRYIYFVPETSKLLQKAHYLYKKYAPDMGMTYNQFNSLLDELGIEHTDYDFDNLDQNEDGLIGFTEFCKWLNWFSCISTL